MWFIHVDLWGLYYVQTYNGYRYFLTIIDDYSRTTWTHLLATKSKALPLIKGFVEMTSAQFNVKVKTMRSDNALELGLNKEAMEYFLSKGIIYQTSCVETPQQNGVVERKHKHLLETSRALLFHSGLPLKYWGECVLTSTYLINRFPSKVLKGLSPFHLLFGKKPSYDHLKVFGSLCYASTLKSGRDKFQPRAIPSIFLGYPFGQKAYKLLNLETHQVFTSRDVVFHEQILPYHHIQSPKQSILFPNYAHLEEDHGLPHSQTMVEHSAYPHSGSPTSDQHTHIHDSTTMSHHSENSSTHMSVRRSTRDHKTLAYLSEYVCSNAISQRSNSQLIGCPSIVTSVCCNVMSSCQEQLSLESTSLLQHLESYTEPASYEEAASRPEWQEAMKKEFGALRANHTWDLMPLPTVKKPISCKWFIKSSTRLIEPLKDARLGWLLEILLRKRELTTLKLSPPWLK